MLRLLCRPLVPASALTPLPQKGRVNCGVGNSRNSFQPRTTFFMSGRLLLNLMWDLFLALEGPRPVCLE